MNNNNKTTFKVTANTNSDLVNITAPLSIHYLIDDKNTVDNVNGMVYPNFAVANQNIYNTLDKTFDIFNKKISTGDDYTMFDHNQWYGLDSLVYIKGDGVDKYKFYKSNKMTNPLVKITNQNYWSEYNTQIWLDSSDLPEESHYSYAKGTMVRVNVNGLNHFYEAIKDIEEIYTSINDTEYWKPLNLEAWSFNEKYTVGTFVYADRTIYRAIKTVFAVTSIDDKEYWSRYFNEDKYGLLDIAETVDDNLFNELTYINNNIIKPLKARFETDTSSMSDEEINEMYRNMAILVDELKDKWNTAMNIYENLPTGDSVENAYLWKNMKDTNIYINNLVLYNEDPMLILESIKYLKSFEDLYNDEDTTSILVYVKNLYDKLDPAQKNGGYFLYDYNRKKFIKVLVGQHDHRNAGILDSITQSFDEVSGDDTNDKILTIRRVETGEDEYAWEYVTQWKDVEVIPDKPKDGKEYLLRSNVDGEIEWTDSIASSIAFVKRELEITTDRDSIDFEIDVSFDRDNQMIDSIMIFRNSLYFTDYTYQYNDHLRTLTIKTQGDIRFNEGDFITLIMVRNTSLEMLSRLSDNYVSKKELIEVLSNGTIRLTDYAKKKDLDRYSLKNHIHTMYADRSHSHWGVYSDYYHNHDGLYTTRDEVNNMIGNILSANPDLIDIIGSIAKDAETLNDTFVTNVIFNEFRLDTERRLNDLETIDTNTIYVDPNTGLVSVKQYSDRGSIEFKDINIETRQIKTKYKISHEEDELGLYNLEEWLDYISTLITDDEIRIRREIDRILKGDKYLRTIELKSTDNKTVPIKNFKILNMTIDIIKPFNNEISVVFNLDETLIDAEDIIYDQECVMNYVINENVIGDKTINIIKNINDEDSLAILTVTGYDI